MVRSSTEVTFAITPQPEYDHTQWGGLYWLLMAVPLGVLVLPIAFPHIPDVLPAALAVCAILTIAIHSFRWMRVVDEGEMLAIRYGPLPLFRKRIAYADMASAERDTTKFIDGWGIHWVPGRGWTYNVWGFDCVRLVLMGGRTIRVGTDDPDGLARFLEGKVQLV